MERGTRSILLAVNVATDAAAPLARKTRELAEALGARVTVCTVLVELEAIVELNLTYIRYDELFPAEEAKASEQLADFVSREFAGFEGVSTRVVRGRPHTGLLRVAEESGADLIVIGTHGERAIERAVYGSPAQRLIQRAQVPVLVVPLE